MPDQMVAGLDTQRRGEFQVKQRESAQKFLEDAGQFRQAAARLRDARMIMAVSRAFCDADCQFIQALFLLTIDRTINTAEVTYLSANQGSYGDVVSLVSQGLLDTRFTGSVSRYTYTVSASGSDYTVTAMPTSANAGRFGYYSMPDAVIRYSTATSGCGGPGGNCFPPSPSGTPVAG